MTRRLSETRTSRRRKSEARCGYVLNHDYTVFVTIDKHPSSLPGQTQKGGDKKRPGFEGKKKGFVSKKGGHNE